MKKFLVLFTTLTLSLTCASCGKGAGTSSSGNSDNKSAEVTNEASYILPMSDKEISGTEHKAYTEFGIELFKETFDTKENTAISPLSVYYAFAMVANGADGQTLAEIEDTLGMPVEDINNYVYSYMNNLPNTDDYKMHIANSMWINDGFDVYDSYIGINKKYLNAQVLSKPFDNSTCDEVNAWCNENTMEMIPELYNYDSFPRSSVLLLINALAFDAKWENEYEDSDIIQKNFTTLDGSNVSTDFMCSTEEDYLENDSCTGFVKYYKDRKYAFAALLPNEGINIEDFVGDLTCDDVEELLANKISTDVDVYMPKFEAEQDIKLIEILKSMGITQAFLPGADFSKISKESLVITEVRHKTHISVEEKGTEAAAITVIGIEATCPIPDFEKEYKQVELNRPFVYMLIDCENNTPFFVGAVTYLESTD